MSEKPPLNPGMYNNPGYQSQPQQGAYPPQQGNYPPQQGGYPPQQQNSFQPSGPTAPIIAQAQTQGNPQQPQYGATQTKSPVQWDPSTAQQYQGEMGQDFQEERNEEPATPSAPPPIDEVLPGYENTAFTSDVPAGPPPAYDSVVGEMAIVDSKN
uniref:Uncharacterized protein n=1 Tax=Ciona savignyi TaxID=51511 RepID=H2YX34_CIOSA